MSDEVIITKLQELKAKLDAELHNVVKFWLENSHDTSNGYCTDYLLVIFSRPVQQTFCR
jgi:hypothetical protein